MDGVIATGMAKDPDNRYATTVELADAAHDAITTPLAPPSEPTLLDDAAPTTPATEPATEPAPVPTAPPTIAAQDQTPPPDNVHASGLTRQRPPLEVPTHRPELSAELPPTSPSWPWWRRKAVLISAAFIVTVVATVLVVTLASTGNHPASQTSQTSQSALPDAATLLKQSAQTMRDVKSAHVELTVQGKIEHPPIKMLSGDLTNVPAVAAKGHTKVTMGGDEVDADFVELDGTLYAALDPNTWNNFGPASNLYDMSLILNPDTGLANILSNFADPKASSRETINGVQTVKITGQVSADTVNKIFPQIATTGNVPSTVWIQENGNHDLVQIRLEPSSGNSLQMTLSKWNEPVSVEKPPGV
jgi:lipoprotein LprG